MKKPMLVFDLPELVADWVDIQLPWIKRSRSSCLHATMDIDHGIVEVQEIFHILSLSISRFFVKIHLKNNPDDHCSLGTT